MYLFPLLNISGFYTPQGLSEKISHPDLCQLPSWNKMIQRKNGQGKRIRLVIKQTLGKSDNELPSKLEC